MPNLEQLTKTQIYLGDVIWNTGTLKRGAFRLKLHEKNPDAPLSPYYLSMRQKDMDGSDDYERSINFARLCVAMNIALTVQARNFVDLKQIDYVIGIPKAGEPFANYISRGPDLKLLTMEKVEDGNQRRISSVIHGDFKSGQRVLGVDDLITAADTKLEFKESLKTNGLVLAHLAVGIDREQGGMQKLRDAGISVSAALTVSQLLNYYLETGKIDQASFDQIANYRALYS